MAVDRWIESTTVPCGAEFLVDSPKVHSAKAHGCCVCVAPHFRSDGSIEWCVLVCRDGGDWERLTAFEGIASAKCKAANWLTTYASPPEPHDAIWAAQQRSGGKAVRRRSWRWDDKWDLHTNGQMLTTKDLLADDWELA